MRSAFEPERELVRDGVFGPEILLNCETGVAGARRGPQLIGANPSPPLSKAFLVWVGRPVIVVSEGVGPEHRRAVASALRDLVADADIPVVFHEGATRDGVAVSIAYDRVGDVSAKELARAEVFVSVQCAWAEQDRIDVEVDGRRHGFRVAFLPLPDGRHWPTVTAVSR